MAIGGPEVTDGDGVATITDDDPMPAISVKDAPGTVEGGTAAFTIALSAPSGRDIAVAFATARRHRDLAAGLHRARRHRS